jgi:predicted ATPase
MATTKTPGKKEKQTKRLDLKVGMKDFGPIAEGEIELKPLTVFIGPNNSGKSYAAMLIHSVLKSYTSPLLGQIGPLRSIDGIKEHKALRKALSELWTITYKLKIGDEWNITNEICREIISAQIKDICENILAINIASCYACQLNDLIMLGKRDFSLNVGFGPYSIQLIFQKGELVVKNFRQPDPEFDIRVKINTKPDFPTTNKQATNKQATEQISFLIKYRIASGPEEEIYISEELIPDFEYIILNILIYEIRQRFMSSFYFLPSARSDKLQFYKLIAGNAIRQQKIPKLSGVVSDFISSIIEISPEKKGHYYQFAEELEQELLKGSIVFESSDPNLLPEVKYKFQGTEIPLQRASSSVTEIAPLILYLKYIVQPGSVLIIEEPEAHLHPANIRILAKYLVRLVRKGVNVLITTHSEYLLEQLDNFVMLRNIAPEERVERYGYEKDDFIKHTDFAVYEFHYDQSTGTSKIERAELTKKDGVSQEEFVKVFEELYEETDKLRRDLSDE